MCEQCRNHKSGFLEGITVGVLLGVAVSVLLGTEEGKKIQKSLKKKASPYIEDIVGVLDDLKSQSSSLLEKAEEVKDALGDKLGEKKQELSVAVTDTLENSLTHIEELQQRGRDATAIIRKKFFKNIKKH